MASESHSRFTRRQPPGRLTVVVTIEKDCVSGVLPAVEQVLANCEAQRDAIRTALPLEILADGRSNYKVRLPKEKRGAAAAAEPLEERLAFWSEVVTLKRDLTALPGPAADAGAVDEADAIAKIIIQTIYDLSQEYRIAGSALIQNFLINRGIKKKGFCYHYVSDIRRALAVRAWRAYELRWGEAWPNDFRENNALVITKAGQAFQSGLAIDAWRTAGKPFWTKVQGDRFPARGVRCGD